MNVGPLPRALVLSLCLSFLAAAAPVRSQEPAATGTPEATANQPWIGQPAPGIDLVSTKGEQIKLGDFQGEKLVVIHFAASW